MSQRQYIQSKLDCLPDKGWTLAGGDALRVKRHQPWMMDRMHSHACTTAVKVAHIMDHPSAPGLEQGRWARPCAPPRRFCACRGPSWAPCCRPAAPGPPSPRSSTSGTSSPAPPCAAPACCSSTPAQAHIENVSDARSRHAIAPKCCALRLLVVVKHLPDKDMSAHSAVM